jgi:hypothetical protein
MTNSYITTFTQRWQGVDESRSDISIQTIIFQKIIPCITTCLGQDEEFTQNNIKKIMEVNSTNTTLINVYLKSTGKKQLTNLTRNQILSFI